MGCMHSLLKPAFIRALRECYVYKGDDYQNVIVHEASHLFMHYHNYYGVPKWINEGLSTFFESLYLDEKGRVYVDPQKGRIMQVGGFVNDNTLNLTQFLSPANNAAWNLKDQATAQYSIAYAIVYYIIKTNPQLIKQILNMLNNGKSSYDVLSQCYGSFEFFESRFKLYYSKFR
ncbi:DUF1570 domain-containing protein [Mucilaginibacter terrae]|nr:DUF1570 domain-containing protein [Mucilaginibacter terrae]